MRYSDAIFIFSSILFLFWIGSVLKGPAKRIYIAVWFFILGLVCLGGGVLRMRRHDTSFTPGRRGGIGSAQQVLAGVVFVTGGFYYLRLSGRKEALNQPTETTRGK